MGLETDEKLSEDLREIRNSSVEFGRILANPPAGEEIVISGVSGHYPDSDNVHEFRDNLLNKVDMVSDDNRRWEPGHPEVPQRTGKLFDISKFDPGYFGIHHRQAHSSDPMLRILLETVISAIFDAGLNPSDLEGTNTGVFVGSCFSESEKCWFLDNLIPQSGAITGCQRSMLANRVSYFLKLTGPSFVCDTACSSSLYALENAYKAIRLGKCERAIVGGSNMCLHPFVSLQFARLGVLNADGCCRVFDKNGTGYARSEAVSAIVLQKAKDSNRIYCTVLHAKTNCDGYKNSGIMYPSGEMQVQLLEEFYQECTFVKPCELSFLEAHGTGTKVGDPEEVQAVEHVFLPGRTSPLLIGSVKSNIGHTEPTSGLCSVTKAIIAIETGLIPPNLHYNEPRPEFQTLFDEQVKVITEKTPFKDQKGLIGINSFGFGGGNCHVLLRHNTKTKPQDPRPKDNIPRLICVTGRTEETVDLLLSDVIENKLDIEHIRLLHNIFKINAPGHLHRGFLFASKSGGHVKSLRRASSKTKLTLCFGDIGHNLNKNIRDWLTSPVVSSTIQKIQHCLTSSGVQVADILLKQELTMQEQILNNFFLHIVLADLIKACDIQPDKIFGLNKGLSLGVLIAAYFDQAINLKDAVECALCIVRTWVENKILFDVSDLSEIISEGGDAIGMKLHENISKILKTPRKSTNKIQVDEFSASYLINSFAAANKGITLQKFSTKDCTIYEIGKGDLKQLLGFKGHNAKPVCIDTGTTFDDFLVSLGRLHECGFALHLHNIYPKVELPVSRGTPMIAPKMKWNHENDWYVIRYLDDNQLEVGEKTFRIALMDPNYTFIKGHTIDGRVLFPATGYLHLVWITLAYMHGLMINDLKVVFENCRFKRACTVQEDNKSILTVIIQRVSGKFEVVESDTCVVTGTIRRVSNEKMAPIPLSMGVPKHLVPHMSAKDVYKELRLRGYNYKDIFQGIKSCDNSVQVAEITWSSNWMAFMDNMLQLKIIQEDTRLLYVPTGIQRLFIDPKRHMEIVKSSGVKNPDLPVFISKDTGIIRCGGIEFKGLIASSIPRRKYLASPVLEKYVFVPNYAKLTIEQAVRVNMQLILENMFSITVKAVKQNLVVNIYKDGQWGTYRHLLLENTNEVPVEHCYLNSLVRGDLTSLRWLEGNLSCDRALEPGRVLISVYYASLNFRDVMTASGRINVDSITRNRRHQDCVQGFEYAGRTQSGKRVCGMTNNGACASLIDADCTIEIPDHLTMEEAATIPVVYGTSYYALFKRGKMKRGDTVLIHSGTGGIGQAAITLALYFGCTVYTTVGTKEKREFLKKMFPQLSDNNISSSRDTEFEKHIMAQTSGRGVDVVLNSLAEEKLFASVRCLAKGGRFMEIGKFDLANDSELQMLFISKGASFHGVMLDLVCAVAPSIRVEIEDFIREGINKGFIRPLNRTVFKMNQTEEAFRYMASGKHTGKVMIQIREEEENRIVPLSKTLFPGLPRYFCDSNKTYIICGGLGGFGLELADWLALRGCKNLVLTSRSGIKTGYQAYRISIWKTYGCTIKIATDDITTYEGCLRLIKKANNLGPVHAIFNLAVVLKDALLANQNEESFRISFGPKAYATEFLDKVSRQYCPELRDFVVFSSVSCGRGNAGQSNYGMSNSVMERICEERRREGFPALAIQWGAIGDVGLVAELQNDSAEREIGGTLQQRISNCLQIIDILLRQNESAVVSSMIVAEKRAGSGGANNIVEAVANILGIKDIKAISHQATLAELGMDSITAVEIKQTLERDYDLFLTASDIKTMTFAKLISIQAERNSDLESGTKKERALMGMDMVLRLMGDEKTINVPVLPISGQKCQNSMSLSTVVLLPGVEGTMTIMEPLYKNLLGNLVGLQYTTNTQKNTIQEMAQHVLPIIESKFSKSKTFNIVSYSFGGLVALEAVALLEEKGYLGTVICIDSSPDYMNALSKNLEVESDDKFQVRLLVHLMAMHVSYDTISKHTGAMLKLTTLEDRIKFGLQIVGNQSPYSADYQRAFAISLYKRLRAILEYVPDYKLKSKVVLFKPTLPSFELSDADYGLSKYCENPVEVRVFEGNHASVLENEDMASAINDYFPAKDVVEQGKKMWVDVEQIKSDVTTKI